MNLVEIEKFRSVHAAGVDGDSLESALVAACHEAVALANEAHGRAGNGARELVRSIVGDCTCPHEVQGSSDVPVSKDRHSAFSLVAEETALGRCGAGVLAAAAKARHACGPLVSAGGVSHPAEALEAFRELEEGLSCLDKLILKTAAVSESIRDALSD
jgi:hypothetical protein